MSLAPIDAGIKSLVAFVGAFWLCLRLVEGAGESNKSNGNQCHFDP